MESPSANLSPKFKNLKKNQRNSPVEIKEKMRQNYKNKIQHCRGMLMNRFRGTEGESELRNTLTEIYKTMSNLTDAPPAEEEVDVLETIKNELIQEEFEWWLEEYDKSQMNVDWSLLEEENNVICPICQKYNLCLTKNFLSCIKCQLSIKTQKSLSDIKKSILSSLEKHSSVCNNEFQFVVVPELDESHIYLICNSCLEMQIVV